MLALTSVSVEAAAPCCWRSVADRPRWALGHIPTGATMADELAVCAGVYACGCGWQAKWRRWHANIGSLSAQAIKQTKKNQTNQHKKKEDRWYDAEKESKNDLDFGK